MTIAAGLDAYFRASAGVRRRHGAAAAAPQPVAAARARKAALRG